MPDRNAQSLTSEHAHERAHVPWLRSIGCASALCTALACSLDYSIGPFAPADGGNGQDQGPVNGDGPLDADVGPVDGSPPPDAAATRPVAFVNGGSMPPKTGKTLSISLDAATKAGNLLVVVTGQETNTSTGISAITDNAPGGGNTYVSANAVSIDEHDNDRLEIWYAANARPGATSVTVTMEASVEVEAWVMEFSGLNKTVSVDVPTPLSNQSTSQLLSAPRATASALPSVIVSAAMTEGDISSLAFNSPFQARPILKGENAAYVIPTEAGTAYQAVWYASEGTWNASTVVFK